MAKKYYSRKNLRRHFATNIYISSDGKHAERYIQLKTGKDDILVYDIYKDECGRAFIDDKYKGKLYIDRLVLTCFRCREPQDGKSYYPHHKDGNLGNSCISNLEWREETPVTVAANEKLEKEAWYKNRRIKAHRNGTITQNGTPLTFVDYISDSDMGWIYHYPDHTIRYKEKNRWGRYDERRKEVNEIFEDFGLIEGDKALFSSPVILHRNNDYTDYSCGNLVWCESSDPIYKAFDKIRHDAVMEKDRTSNHPVDERSWQAIYNGKEPYQNWSDKPKE